MGKDNGDNAAARAQLNDAVAAAEVRQTGKKNRIDREAISFPFLADSQLSLEQGIMGERAPCFYQDISSPGERGFMTSPLVTLG